MLFTNFSYLSTYLFSDISPNRLYALSAMAHRAHRRLSLLHDWVHELLRARVSRQEVGSVLVWSRCSAMLATHMPPWSTRMIPMVKTTALAHTSTKLCHRQLLVVLLRDPACRDRTPRTGGSSTCTRSSFPMSMASTSRRLSAPAPSVIVGAAATAVTTSSTIAAPRQVTGVVAPSTQEPTRPALCDPRGVLLLRRRRPLPRD